MYVYLLAADRGKSRHVIQSTLAGMPIAAEFRYGIASVPANVGRALIDSGHVTPSFAAWGADLVVRGAAQAAQRNAEQIKTAPAAP